MPEYFKRDLSVAAVLVFCAVFVLVLSSNLPYRLVTPSDENQEASIGGAIGHFGGMVEYVIFCTCSVDGSAVITVGPPRGGDFLYIPEITKVYEYFMIPRVGVWVLGNYNPGGQCLIYAGEDCAVVPNQGTISIVGTSR